MDECRLDWSRAEVKDGRLTVPLDGDGDSAWTKEFAWVAERLSSASATWGEVKAGKSKVTVAGVTPGSEDDVRHFLESVVQQVNADQRSGDAEGDEGAGDSGEPAGPDQEMTDAFRGFGESEQEPAEQD